MVDTIVADKPYEPGARVALMINGLGSTPISELYLLYGHAHDRLADKGLHVQRSYVGNYCTALDMAGASITLVELDDEIDALLDAPASTALHIY
jgi:dihydroxyacetone kinase-like protein